jgi:BirA family biotin operon repressor/biotin-[acetyl-CoA-carboxylase] ligase
MWPATIDVDRIRGELRSRRVGRHLEHLNSTPSTNDVLWHRINEESVDGAVALAEHQTTGRGRFGRTWDSPRGAGLLCSVGIVDRRQELTGGELGLLTAVAACDAIRSVAEVIPTIRWPNDLLVSGRKVGGILVEARARHDGVQVYVIGIGINCLQQRGHFAGELSETATSLDIESRQVINRTALAIALLQELDHWLKEPTRWTYDHLHDAWRARAESPGGHVRLRSADKTFSGTVIDVDPQAALVVQLDEGGLRKFDAADTTIVSRDSMAGG